MAEPQKKWPSPTETGPNVKQPWTKWLCGNLAGTPTLHIVTPYPVSGLQVQEKGGKGIVNLRLGYRDANGQDHWTVWLTDSEMEGQVRTIWLPKGVEATGVSVREQTDVAFNIGLVDIQLESPKGPSGWACKNQEGHVFKEMLSESIRGVQLRDQVGTNHVGSLAHTDAEKFGIVNVRVGPGPLWSGIVGPEVLNNSPTWMNDHWNTIKDRALWQMVIPSSHDAASFGLLWRSRTQGATLYEQLLYGLRSFDIRIATTRSRSPRAADQYRIHHGPDLSRFSFRDLLLDIRKFLDLKTVNSNTEREIFILSIRSDVDDDHKDNLYKHDKPTFFEDESVIGEMVDILGKENIVDHKFVSKLNKKYPAACTPGELVGKGSKKRVVIVWWSNHDKGLHDQALANDAHPANYVWLSDLVKNGVPTYGPSAEYENAYYKGDDLNIWLDQCVSTQKESDTRYWYRGGDVNWLVAAANGVPSPLGMPWNLVGGDYMTHEEYKVVYNTFIGKTLGKFDFRALTATWTQWACSNKDTSAHSRPPLSTPYPVCAIQVREWGGHGIMNLRLGYRDSAGVGHWSEWLIDSEDGKKGVTYDEVWLPETVMATGLTIREQRTFGVVNIRLDSSISEKDPKKNWACPKTDSHSEHRLTLPPGHMSGAQVREQNGDRETWKYGLIDVRVCSSLPL
jgi:hypothetical protein